MTGCIDVHGYLETSGSWMLCGWAPATSSGRLSGPHPLAFRFEHGMLDGEGLVVETRRDDLGDRGCGLMVQLPASERSLGRLLSVEIMSGDERVVLHATSGTREAQGAELIGTLRAQRLAPHGEEVDRFRAVLNRPIFEGSDTVDRFEDQFAVRIDEAIACGDGDMLLNGWLMAASPGVRAVRLRSGRRSTPIDVRAGVRVPRPDAVAKFGEALRSRNVNCGFVLHVADCLQAGAPAYLEIEAGSGDIAFLRLVPSRLRGLAAIRSMLSHLSPRYDEVQRTFDLIGPALDLLNRARLAAPRASRTIQFGVPPEIPLCSVIVPLYGRIDYMEPQVALLAQGGFARNHEMIYVVDDPDQAEAACLLADSLFRRFRLPLRLILLEENLGFAPACNAGLAAAQGGHVCFLNSDVFALRPGWLDQLLAHFNRHPSVGIIGPLLVFEDGTIQHQGMRYEALPEFGHWLFPVHPGKGSRPAPSSALALYPAITGACMVMSRQLAVDLDGFDESYVIGDFEDSDLCLRARQRGVACAVDHGVVLHHLERKSQASGAEGWRMNVTLFNAWLHQTRWADRLAAEAGGLHDAAAAAASPGPVALGKLAVDPV